MPSFRCEAGCGRGSSSVHRQATTQFGWPVGIDRCAGSKGVSFSRTPSLPIISVSRLRKILILMFFPEKCRGEWQSSDTLFTAIGNVRRSAPGSAESVSYIASGIPGVSASRPPSRSSSTAPRSAMCPWPRRSPFQRCRPDVLGEAAAFDHNSRSPGFR